MVDQNNITEEIIGAAIEVHKILGPGLLESAYEACLVYELTQRDLSVKRQQPLNLKYKGIELDCAYRLDLLVEDKVIVELKTVEKLTDVHTAQLISYLKIADLEVGLLINFNVKFTMDGIKRVVNKFKEKSHKAGNQKKSSADSATSAVKSRCR